MPLHAEHEARARQLDRLGQLVELRAARDDEAVADAVDALVVMAQRPVRLLARGARGQGARRQPDLVVGTLKRSRIATVVVMAVALGQVLQQRAAAGDVEHLHPAADPEERQIPLDRALGQRDLERVALRVDVDGRGVHGLAVGGGVDVRAAGEDQAVEQVEQLVGMLGRARIRRQQQRDAAGALDRVGVLTRQQMRRRVPDAPPRALQRRAQPDNWSVFGHVLHATAQQGARLRDVQLARQPAPIRSSPMTELETINIHRRGGAATIELARPETMNAWNKQFGLDLLAAVEEVRDDETVRAICLTGAGRGFSSGADLRDISDEQTPQGRPDVYKVLTERYHPIITGLRTMPKPVVAAVNGPAVGIGLSLALAADLVVAKESAYFLLAFVNIGLAPDGGSSLFVPERVGFTRAIEMAMLGERVPARQAAEWGLANKVFTDAEFDTEVAALVDRLAAGPTAAYAGIKRQLNAWLYARMDGQLELEAQVQREMAHSDDFVEGVSAFLQKRPSAFSGR